MRQKLYVFMGGDGAPRAEVPSAAMWELVEYLSYQRVSVTYQYQATHFVVVFPRNDSVEAQRVLDEWVSSAMHELQPA